MMVFKKNNIDKEMIKLDIITSGFCLIPMMVGLILYSKLPTNIAVHFDVNNKPQLYAGKAFVVFVIPILMLLVHTIVCIASERDDKKNNVNRRLTYILRFAVPVITVTIEAIIFMYALEYVVSASTVVLILCGVIMFVVGNYLPKCKQNHFIGFKLTWTMKNEINWNKTHRLAGWLWALSGIFMIILGVFNFPQVFCAIPLTLAFVVPFIYSFSLSLKGKNKNKKVAN